MCVNVVVVRVCCDGVPIGEVDEKLAQSRNCRAPQRDPAHHKGSGCGVALLLCSQSFVLGCCPPPVDRAAVPERLRQGELGFLPPPVALDSTLDVLAIAFVVYIAPVCNGDFCDGCQYARQDCCL